MTDATLPSLVDRARTLAWVGNAWHVAEFAIAVGAGIAAGSIALVAFGADSLIEGVAGGILIWRLRRGHVAERRAQQLIAGSFFLLAAYVTAEALRTLAGGHHPRTSAVGIGLAVVTSVTMPLLARAKRRVGRRMHSSATVNEAAQTQLCAYMSVALLAGLVANAALGWWWADPAAGYVLVYYAAREVRAIFAADH